MDESTWSTVTVAGGAANCHIESSTGNFDHCNASAEIDVGKSQGAANMIDRERAIYDGGCGLEEQTFTKPIFLMMRMLTLEKRMPTATLRAHVSSKEQEVMKNTYTVLTYLNPAR